VNPLTPYLLWIKLGLVALLGVSLVAGGWRMGADRQARKDAALIERKNAALRKAGDALSATAIRFREINAMTAAEVAEAARDQKDGEAAGREAARDQRELERRIAAINAARDESPCRDTPTGVRLQ
jgi:hypothetical protein